LIAGEIDAMSLILPSARLGIILSSGNWTLETYFRAYAPADLGIHVTRMRMGSGGERRPGDIEADVLQAARLLADAEVDLIDLQGTGIMMERGPDGEAAMVAAIEDATGTPAYTATGAAVEALRTLDIRRLVLVGPYGEAAIGRESAFLEAAGFSVVDAVGLARGERSNQVPPADWVAAAGGGGGCPRPRRCRRHFPQRLQYPHGGGRGADRARPRQARRHQRPGGAVGRHAAPRRQTRPVTRWRPAAAARAWPAVRRGVTGRRRRGHRPPLLSP
jgi:maleate cis-trans isomerase